MIDKLGRQRIMEDSKTKLLVDGMKESIKAMIENQSKTGGNEEVLKLVVEQKQDTQLIETVNKIANGLALVIRASQKPISIPKMFHVWGSVDINKPVKIDNFKELERYFSSLEERVGQLSYAISNIPQAKIEIPKFDIPKSAPVDMSKVIEAIKDLKPDGKDSSSGDMLTAIYRMEEAIAALANRPNYVPPTITHVSINALQGVPKQTTMTVGVTPTQLPPTNLANRRAILVYNNDATKTLYIGDSTVNVSGTGQGLPVPAGAYAPALEIGQNVNLYGRSTGNISVTVLELSEEGSGR